MEISVDEIIKLKKIIFGQNDYVCRTDTTSFGQRVYERVATGNADYLKLYVETINKNEYDIDIRSNNTLKLNNKIILLSFSCNEITNESNSLIHLNKIEFNHYLKISTTSPNKYHPSFKSFKVFNQVFYIDDREAEQAIHTITNNNYIKSHYKFHPIHHVAKQATYKETRVNYETSA